MKPISEQEHKVKQQMTMRKHRNVWKEGIMSILHLSLIYKTIRTIVYLFTYIKDYLYIKDTLYSEQFLYVLKKYLNVQFKKDWIGRLYGVINPSIDINGNIDFSTQIIEFTEDGLSTDNYVQNWVYKQMQLIKSVFNLQQSGFFDYIGVEFKHVGPLNGDNWLVVFDIPNRKLFSSYIKKTLKQLILYGIIGTIAYFTIFS